MISCKYWPIRISTYDIHQLLFDIIFGNMSIGLSEHQLNDIHQVLNVVMAYQNIKARYTPSTKNISIQQLLDNQINDINRLVVDL